MPLPCCADLKSAGAAAWMSLSDSPDALGSFDFPFSSSSPAHRFGVIYFLHNAPNQSQVNGFSDFALFCVIYFLEREFHGKFSCRLEMPDSAACVVATAIRFESMISLAVNMGH
jgi:hypothetical protein